MPDATSSTAPTLVWLRRDLRLADHPAFAEAVAGDGPVIPVFILDPLVEQSHGAAPLWRLGESLRSLAADLQAQGSRLILRRGEAAATLGALIAETGARTVLWSRLYDDRSIGRDKAIKAALAGEGVDARSVNGSLLFEPWTVSTGTGGFYRVYTPFWRAARNRDVGAPLAASGKLPAPDRWPASDRLDEWKLGARMDRGAAVVARHARVGEAAAGERLRTFLETKIKRYGTGRDYPGQDATSGLSEHLAYGEISPREIWTAAHDVLERIPSRSADAEQFLKELVWREFAYHLLYHTPTIGEENWRSEWDAFPWRSDNGDAERWRRGMTGIEIVDAAMRELYVTGRMHNRARMIVASFLTKHLMTHWRVGAEWFGETLIDWDPASNALGWQWTAGSGPDAAPFFRIFNPETQAKKFDPDRIYRDRFIAEGRAEPHEDALAFFDAVPRSWGLSPDQRYPAPMIALAHGRERALAAYRSRDTE